MPPIIAGGGLDGPLPACPRKSRSSRRETHQVGRRIRSDVHCRSFSVSRAASALVFGWSRRQVVKIDARGGAKELDSDELILGIEIEDNVVRDTQRACYDGGTIA